MELKALRMFIIITVCVNTKQNVAMKLCKFSTIAFSAFSDESLKVKKLHHEVYCWVFAFFDFWFNKLNIAHFNCF